MRSWRPFCCGWPGLMRSMAMPRRSHHTESLERLKRPFGLTNGTPLSDLIAWGRPRSWKSWSKAVMARRRVAGVGPTTFADRPGVARNRVRARSLLRVLAAQRRMNSGPTAGASLARGRRATARHTQTALRSAGKGFERRAQAGETFRPGENPETPGRPGRPLARSRQLSWPHGG